MEDNEVGMVELRKSATIASRQFSRRRLPVCSAEIHGDVPRMPAERSGRASAPTLKAPILTARGVFILTSRTRQGPLLTSDSYLPKEDRGEASLEASPA